MPAGEPAQPHTFRGVTFRKVNRWHREVGVRSEYWLIVRGWDLQKDEVTLENPFRIRAEIGRWCRNPSMRAVVLAMYREAYGATLPVQRTAARANWLEERLVAAFERKVLVVLTRPAWDAPPRAEDEEEDEDEAENETPLERRPRDPGRTLDGPKKTWVEIKLVDQDGAVVPNERYRITLPDGTVKEGALDEDGWMRESGIDPGDCLITFPDIHYEEWDPI